MAGIVVASEEACQTTDLRSQISDPRSQISELWVTPKDDLGSEIWDLRSVGPLAHRYSYPLAFE